jgi:hypothetical protein
MGQKRYKREQGLTIEQLNAIDILITGKSDQAVADAIGVSRPTVTSWRLYDPHFQAELNRRRKEVWGASVDRMRTLLPKAFDTLERAIDEGSYRAALELIKLAGLDGVAGVIGTDDAEKIIKEQKKAALWDDFL